MYLIVRFIREVCDDAEIAAENFPHLHGNPRLQMVEQFKMELYANLGLRGYWTTINHELRKPKDDQLFVWVGFQWPGDQASFCEVLQDTYNTEGMAGSFKIIDVET